ncbi:MAG TPA: lectin-like protein [Phycisphaerae bacterium]|nr:lectin-like protein [Phycisphaerae bacterium]
MPHVVNGLHGRVWVLWLPVAVVLCPATGLSQPVYFAGTGNYYEVISSEGISGRDRAHYQAWKAGGHLVTITSAEENDFVTSLLTPGQTYWIGGYQTSDGIEPDGGWRWSTGEAWEYSNWAGSGPSNPTWLRATHTAGTFNANLAGWITGDGGRFEVRFADEPAVGPVTFEEGMGFTMADVARRINTSSQAAAGYDAATITYDSAVNRYFLEIVAQAPGDGQIVIDADQAGMGDADFLRGLLEGDHLTISGSTGLWYDATKSLDGIGLIVEYPAPEPSALAVVAIALPMLRRRRPRG